MAIESTVGEVAIATNLKQFLLVLSVSLSVATLPKIVSWFRKIPYTLLLVIAGLGLAFIDVRLVNLSPELILSIFLPPLVFEAAWNLQWSRLKQDFLPICLFAVMGVLISIAGIALGLNQLIGLSLPTALLIGASLSATDPVSVVALFRELGVDKRLSTLMEGESLFNDGMAIDSFWGITAIARNIWIVMKTDRTLFCRLLRGEKRTHFTQCRCCFGVACPRCTRKIGGDRSADWFSLQLVCNSFHICIQQGAAFHILGS